MHYIIRAIQGENLVPVGSPATIASEKFSSAVPHGTDGQSVLPMARASADRLSLHVHVALDSMRRGFGNVAATQTLAQVMFLSESLASQGYGMVSRSGVGRAEAAIVGAYERGRQQNVWCFDAEDFETFAAIVTIFDYQLQNAPLSAHILANAQFEQRRTGEFAVQRVAECAWESGFPRCTSAACNVATVDSGHVSSISIFDMG